MKLMVSGIGGVGGYIAAVLCRYYPGSVTLIARGERKKALEQRGLVVHSAVLGEQTYHPAVTDCPADVGIQDVIFVCVKTFSLDKALAALRPCVDEHTVVVPVMNGIDHADRTRAALPAGRVVNSLIYITSSYDGEYAICHASPYVRMRADSPDRDARSMEKIHHKLRLQHDYGLLHLYDTRTAGASGTASRVSGPSRRSLCRSHSRWRTAPFRTDGRDFRRHDALPQRRRDELHGPRRHGS